MRDVKRTWKYISPATVGRLSEGAGIIAPRFASKAHGVDGAAFWNALHRRFCLSVDCTASESIPRIR